MNPSHKPVHELADVVRLFGNEFEQHHHPLKQHQRVLNAIAKCRTAALGGHMDQCDQCGHQRISYNSCRNRHCPSPRWIFQVVSNPVFKICLSIA